MTEVYGQWRIDLHEDDDGHLTVGINHLDGSKVMDTGADMLETNDSELVSRFTTKQIEDDYKENHEQD